MRYHKAGLDPHPSDTNYLTNLRRNIGLFLTLIPKGSLIFGTRDSAWRSYFSDHLDRCRDANDSHKALMVTLKVRRQQLDRVSKDRDVQKRTADYHRTVGNQLREDRDHAMGLRDEAVAEKGMAVRSLDRLKKVASLLREQRDVSRATVSDLRMDIRDANADLSDECEAHAQTTAAAQGWKEMAEDRDQQLDQALDQVAKLTKRITFTQDCNVRQAERIRVLDNGRMADQQNALLRIEKLKEDVEFLAQRNIKLCADIRDEKHLNDTLHIRLRNLSNRNDQLRDMMRAAVGRLNDNQVDMYRGVLDALSILEGRTV